MKNTSQCVASAVTAVDIGSPGLADRFHSLGSLLSWTLQSIYQGYMEHELMRLAPTRLPRD